MTQMVTTCTNCRQQLAVTPADLRVGQGFVRCGRCDFVFNALLTLAEDAPAPEEASSVAHGTTTVPALEEQEPLPPLPPLPETSEEVVSFDNIDDVEVVQTHSTGDFRSLELQADVAPEIDGESLTAATPQTDSAEEAALRLDAEPGPAQLAGEDLIAAEILQDIREEDELRDVVRQAASQPIDILLHEVEPDAADDALPPPPVVDDDFDANAAIGNRPARSWGWYVAGLLLALALAAQIAHHNRQTLAAKPWAQPAIEKVYGLMGQTVEPRWNLSYYEVTALGGLDLRGDARTVVLRAAVTVKKDAPHGQPPPLIRAELSDRFGNVLTRSEQAPRDWLLGVAPARMAPGDRLDAQLSMPAPERVNSFVLSACLPDSTGTLRCYGDP